MGEIKLICQSSLSAFFSLQSLPWATRLGWAGLQLLALGLFVCGNSTVKNLWSDSREGKKVPPVNVSYKKRLDGRVIYLSAMAPLSL